MSHNPPIGQIITTPQERDAIHFALAPVTASERLEPGQRIGFAQKGNCDLVCHAGNDIKAVGIVDPFLEGPVFKGERFFLFLLPGTVTSMRHSWGHPDWANEGVPAPATIPTKTDSEVWMRKWVTKHMSEDYYGDYEKPLGEDIAYGYAIQAGHDMNIGPYESARDHIDSEWWGHWEAITGCTGKRGEYFSCAC